MNMDHGRRSFDELDMRKQGVDVSTKNSILKNSGGSCDLFKGEIKLADGAVSAVALKRIRSSLTRNERFAKVRVSVVQHELCLENLKAFHGGITMLVETRPCQYCEA